MLVTAAQWTECTPPGCKLKYAKCYVACVFPQFESNTENKAKQMK